MIRIIKACAPLAALLVAGCVTVSGTYELTARDAAGQPIQMRTRMIAQGSGIYTVLGAICKAYPGATVTITSLETKQELAGESPHRCK